ncbi:helix-turn-helix domain-containing protein [Jatrophihabitans sp. DSM 45814]
MQHERTPFTAFTADEPGEIDDLADLDGGTASQPDRSLDVAELGRRIRSIREGRNWTRADVARLSEGRWSATALGTYERGERVMTAVGLFALAHFYRVSVIDLIQEEPNVAEGNGGSITIDSQRLAESQRWPRLDRFVVAVQQARQGPRRRFVALRARDLPRLAAIHNASLERFIDDLRADDLITGSLSSET